MGKRERSKQVKEVLESELDSTMDGTEEKETPVLGGFGSIYNPPTDKDLEAFEGSLGRADTISKDWEIEPTDEGYLTDFCEGETSTVEEEN